MKHAAVTTLAVLGMLAVMLAGLLASAAPASAEIEYPYCIITGGRSEGVMSCGYTSLAQCMATRIGTDMCVSNPRYQANPAARQQRRARHRSPG